MSDTNTFFVVDTNVPIVANGKSEVSAECTQNCIYYIRTITSQGRIAIDDQYLILAEYNQHLRSMGEPGLGDAFLKWVHNNYSNIQRCILVPITRILDDSESYQEFPKDPRLMNFDPADRKFVAVSAAHQDHPPILQATDSRWLSWEQPLNDCGITVLFICPVDIQMFASQKAQ